MSAKVKKNWEFGGNEEKGTGGEEKAGAGAGAGNRSGIFASASADGRSNRPWATTTATTNWPTTAPLTLSIVSETANSSVHEVDDPMRCCEIDMC